MAWYITYVICNNWARDFMNTQVFGNINVALIFGLLQFVSTFVIAWLYARYCDEEARPAGRQAPRASSRVTRDRRDEHRHAHPDHRPVPRCSSP